MINNRQNGRRRGRGGQQTRNGQPGVPDRGSRLDNRARGNAAQLLEKYKSLARDAQMAGDRVNTEYYLQFADHYFRVLAETRSRFEESRPQRRDEYRDDMGRDDQGGDGNQGDGDDDGDGQRYEQPRGGYDQQGNGQGNSWQGDDDDGEDEPQAQPQQQRRYEAPQQQAPRRDRQPRADAGNGNSNGNGNQGGGDRPVMQDEGERAYQNRPPRRDDRPRREPRAAAAAPAAPEVAERIEIDRLPQGFGTAPIAEAAGDDTPPAPRRRTRRPRPELGTTEA